MIQDIAPHHYHNEYHHFEIQKGDCLLFYRKREVLLAYDDEQIVYPKYEEISKKEARQYSYLFRIDDCRYFLCSATASTKSPASVPFCQLKTCNACKGLIFWLCFSHLLNTFKMIQIQ